MPPKRKATRQGNSSGANSTKPRSQQLAVDVESAVINSLTQETSAIRSKKLKTAVASPAVIATMSIPPNSDSSHSNSPHGDSSQGGSPLTSASPACDPPGNQDLVPSSSKDGGQDNAAVDEDDEKEDDARDAEDAEEEDDAEDAEEEDDAEVEHAVVDVGQDNVAAQEDAGKADAKDAQEDEDAEEEGDAEGDEHVEEHQDAEEDEGAEVEHAEKDTGEGTEDAWQPKVGDYVLVDIDRSQALVKSINTKTKRATVVWLFTEGGNILKNAVKYPLDAEGMFLESEEKAEYLLSKLTRWENPNVCSAYTLSYDDAKSNYYVRDKHGKRVRVIICTRCKSKGHSKTACRKYR